jgi:hypothetical protein
MRRPYLLSFVAGFATCLVITLASGRKEAWDSSLYFIAGIPLMCAAAFAIARHWPARPWRWALTMALGQSVAMALAGGSLSLWPLAIIAMTIVSLPQFGFAWWGGRLGARR